MSNSSVGGGWPISRRNGDDDLVGGRAGVSFDVLNGFAEHLGIVLEDSETSITGVAQSRPYGACLMAVIENQLPLTVAKPTVASLRFDEFPPFSLPGSFVCVVLSDVLTFADPAPSTLPETDGNGCAAVTTVTDFPRLVYVIQEMSEDHR